MAAHLAFRVANRVMESSHKFSVESSHKFSVESTLKFSKDLQIADKKV